MKNLTYENAVLANENVESQGFNLFNLFYRIQNRALICTSNLGLIKLRLKTKIEKALNQ